MLQRRRISVEANGVTQRQGPNFREGIAQFTVNSTAKRCA
jgi:hypothetical protein